MDILSGAIPRMDWEAQDLESAWKTFKQHADFMFSGPLKEKSEPEKCSFLMLWVEEKGATIFSTWKLSDEEQKELKNYVDKFEGYVKPRSNVIFSRYKFHSKIQETGDTFEQFAIQLKILVKDCNYDKTR